MPGEAIDPAVLRQRFSELFDRAAVQVQRTGSDLDETIVDRLLVCETDRDGRVEVVVAFLSTAKQVLEQVRRALASALDDEAAPVRFTIVAAGVRVWLERADENRCR